ncbi:cobalamin biosynthesis protein [Nocardioides pocheonensis]|uniref:Cobalamin biosynthesis protein CobD n=1 Tax=Nocardioides pocheonensis TaxID=661485 RepID=A0A3N0GNY7_9ACTN|nr:cobalamin biosynthesis protein [Nocardioides pocheonensis]RNM13936.1 cobalamin biosynthesis protein [Nocardioides pocheonensis]
MLSRALGLGLGCAADRLLADPARFHPVAGFGRLAGTLEHRTYADDRSAGALHVTVLVGTTALAGAAIERATRKRPVPHALATAIATWAVLGGTSLDREAAAVDRLLADDRLPDARVRLTHLVGRDTRRLDEGEVARAVIESVAENTSDAVVAPLVLGAVGGIPALLGYRAVNTLDAMVGHRDERYERFGWAAARLDDLVNLPGSRVAALLAAALAPVVGGDPHEALLAWRRDAAGHPSPNAGPVEAAFAGALAVRLGGENTYSGRVEDRHVLGCGRPAARHDISRARTLARAVEAGATAIAVLIALRPRRRGAPGPSPGRP